MNIYQKQIKDLNDKLYDVYSFCRNDMKNTAMNIACCGCLTSEQMYQGVKIMWNSDIAKIRMMIENDNFKNLYELERKEENNDKS